MSDEWKGVVVTLGTSMTPERFADADDFAIEDQGHLVVYKGTVKVAVFAPGKWMAAKIR